MKKLIVMTLLILNAQLIFCGGPACHINIANLTGEDLYLMIDYHEHVLSIYSWGEPYAPYLENYKDRRRVLLAGDFNSEIDRSRWPLEFCEEMLIVPEYYNKDQLIQIIYNNIIDINIFDKTGKKIMGMNSILKDGIDSFAPWDSMKDEPEYLWAGEYYINIYKSDITHNHVNITHVTTEKLSMRETDNSAAKIITVLDKGQEVEAIQVGDTETKNYELLHQWIKVRTKDGLEGWCAAECLAPLSIRN
jgi:hypothetical protein